MNDRRLVPQFQFSRGVEHLLTVVRLNTCQILIEAWNCALFMNGKATISGRKAENVGILATEVYFPASFVSFYSVTLMFTDNCAHDLALLFDRYVKRTWKYMMERQLENTPLA